MSDRWLPVDAPAVETVELSPAGGDEWVVVKGDIPGGAMLRLPPGQVLITEQPIPCGERFKVDADRIIRVT